MEHPPDTENVVQHMMALLDRSHLGPADSHLRMSIVRCLSTFYVAQRNSIKLGWLLQQASKQDPDSACAVLRSLPDLLMAQECADERLTLFIDIANSSLSADVRSAAIEGCLSILDRSVPTQDLCPISKKQRSLMLLTLHQSTIYSVSGPTDVILDLRLRGYRLLTLCRNDQFVSPENINHLVEWINMLYIAGDERNVRSHGLCEWNRG